MVRDMRCNKWVAGVQSWGGSEVAEACDQETTRAREGGVLGQVSGAGKGAGFGV